MTRARGFTLIELLVVLVLIGSLAGLAMLAGGIASPARELTIEAERLAGLIGVLADEAVLDNREYGLRIESGAYQALGYDERSGRWSPLNDKPPHRLPEWARLDLELEGQALKLAPPTSRDKRSPGKPANRNSVPQVLLLSNGELSPFRLEVSELRAGGARLQLASDGFRLPKVEVLSNSRTAR
ncbi:type II secretion system minor pseudopilin GspH [Serpens gallinarum]|uniref:Type II secretion system protein H n=1 Tax=Serpens gallinarum TaxID=2763075 RepID=A0ABR8TNP6_9PSED|nr:type II secretion system minor pseudopilin GspH [Serpens gallinarum]MBD7977386.1 type II secretion system minor pseudopilin GspH [Serpens gallinarum]